MKWVVTFAGSRDHYQVPIALAEAGRLEAFVTDFYSPLNRPVWRSAPSWMQRRLARRYAEGLPSQLVQRTWSAVIANQLRGGTPETIFWGNTPGSERANTAQHFFHIATTDFTHFAHLPAIAARRCYFKCTLILPVFGDCFPRNWNTPLRKQRVVTCRARTAAFNGSL